MIITLKVNDKNLVNLFAHCKYNEIIIIIMVFCFFLRSLFLSLFLFLFLFYKTKQYI